MKIFIKRISLFLSLFILLLVGIFYINNGTLRIDFERFKDDIFVKKVEYFSDFIDNNQSINLILGSSLMENSIRPDSLGTKWFSFTNAGQNIYESYKFIDYYKDSVKIDTIILGIQPFDFPISYVKNRKKGKPSLNGSFHIFGRDSITILRENTLLRNLQVIKQENYLDILNIIIKITNLIQVENNLIQVENNLIQVENRRVDVWTRQGFSGRINYKPVDLDSLFLINPKGNNWSLNYFFNVKSPPNLFYFDLFESLTNSLGIKVIYLITPKSKYYHLGMKEEKYDKIWNDIVDSLETKPIEIWDYETMNTDTFDFYYYWDATHTSYNGEKVFTKIIKNRLLK